MRKLNAVLIVPFSFACLYLLLIITGRITAVLPGENTPSLVTANLVSSVISAAAFALAAVPLKYITSNSNDKSSHAPHLSVARSLLLSFAALALLLALSVCASLLLPGENSFSVAAALDALPQSGISRVLLIASLIFRHALVPAIAEELYFRRKLSDALSRADIKPVIILVSTSLAFGLLHRGGIAPVLLATVSGAIMWTLARVTGRTRYPITVHFLYNFITLILMMHGIT